MQSIDDLPDIARSPLRVSRHRPIQPQRSWSARSARLIEVRSSALVSDVAHRGDPSQTASPGIEVSGNAPGLPAALDARPGAGDQRERDGADGQRASDPRPGVPDAGPFVEGQRLDAEVQGRDFTAGFAAEHDRRGARTEPGEIDAEGVGVVAVRVEAKSLAHRRRRDLPADGEVAAADNELDAGAEHPGLGAGEHSGTEGVPAAQATPGPGLL